MDVNVLCLQEPGPCHLHSAQEKQPWLEFEKCNGPSASVVSWQRNTIWLLSPILSVMTTMEERFITLLLSLETEVML